MAKLSYKERALIAEATLRANQAEMVADIVEDVAETHLIDMSNRRADAAKEADKAALGAWDKQFPISKQPKEQSNA